MVTKTVLNKLLVLNTRINCLFTVGIIAHYDVGILFSYSIIKFVHEVCPKCNKTRGE